MNFEIFNSLASLGFSPKSIIDGGANVGAWARGIREIFPDAHIVCIEGNEECFPHLMEFDLEPSLIGDKDTQVEFHVSTEISCSTGNSVLRERTGFFSEGSSTRRSVPMRRLDNVLAQRNIPHIDLLKLDLQGYELPALRGCRNYLSKTEFILFEASLVEYNRGQTLYAHIHDFLSINGFVCFDIIDIQRIAGVPFQADFLYVRSGSSFRPFFSGETKSALIGPNSIHKWALGDHSERESIVTELSTRRALREFTIIDVGGAFNGWSSSIIDALVDINQPTSTENKIIHFQFDINCKHGWAELLDYVNEKGKFDFSICSHTLEDVRDPAFVCEMLAAISKEGFIAMPSKFRELSRFELGSGYYRGYIHHRWLFTIKDLRLVAMPKLDVIDYLEVLDNVANMADAISEIRLWWYNSIPLEMVNGDYMGPNAQAVISYYDLFVNDDLPVING